MGQKNQWTLASLRAPRYTGVSSVDEQNPFATEKKSWSLPSSFLGGLWLFLICALRDLSINLGGRKALLCQCSHFFSFVEACCSWDLCYLSTFPSLKCVFPLFLCFPPPDSVLSHLLAAKWNLLCSCFLNQFKNMIAVHLLVQPKHSKKRGNREEKSTKLTFSCIMVKKKKS